MGHLLLFGTLAESVPGILPVNYVGGGSGTVSGTVLREWLEEPVPTVEAEGIQIHSVS